MQRPHDTERAVDPHVSQWAVRTISRIAATYAIVIGITILVGGAPRFGSVSYEVARNIPGAPWSWGVAILAAGAVLLVGTLIGSPLTSALGAFVAASWSLMFAIAFALAAQHNPLANTTGQWTYGMIAMIFMVVAGVHLAGRPLPWRRWLKRKG